MAVIAGIPWLAAFVGTLLASVVDFVARFLTRKLAVTAVAIAAAVAVVTAFIASMYAFATSISASLPPGLASFGGLFLPTNTDDVIAILVAARFAKWLYTWNIRAIEWKLKAAS